MVGCVLLLLSPAYAEGRYQFHPIHGEFVKSAKPCGQEVQDELWRFIVSKPNLVVLPKSLVIQTTRGRSRVADTVSGTTYLTGYWRTQKPTMMVIATKASMLDPKEAMAIDLYLRVGDLCYEQWQGMVTSD